MTLLQDRPQGTKKWMGVPYRRLVAFALLVAACWGILLATAPSYLGAPVLRSTSPANAETVKSPDDVLLTFDRPVPSGLVTVRVLDPSGDQVVFERPVHPAGRGDTISVPMPKKRYGGTYTVAWTLPSAALTPIGGAFSFDVYSPDEPLGVPDIETAHDPVVATFHAAAVFGAVAAFVVLTGAVFFITTIWPAGADRRSVRRLVTVAWLGLVAATLAVLASNGPYAAWAPLRDVFDPRLLTGTFESGAGTALLTRLYVLVPASLGLFQLMGAPGPGSTRERWARGAAVLGCATAVAATWSLPTGPTPLALLVDTVLLTAVAVAVGGLVMLVLPRGRDLSVVPRFRQVVWACAGLIVVAAGYLGWRHGPANGSYGWLIAGLFALVVLFVVTFAVIARRQRAIGHLRTLRVPAGVATGAAAVILSATAIAVISQPPRTAHAQEPPSVAAAVREQMPPTRLSLDTGTPVGKAALDLVVVPSSAGPNQVHLDVHASVVDATGAGKDATITDAVFNRPDHTAPPAVLPLRVAAPGYSAGSVTLVARGHWELAFTVVFADGSRQTLTQAIDVN